MLERICYEKKNYSKTLLDNDCFMTCSHMMNCERLLPLKYSDFMTWVKVTIFVYCFKIKISCNCLIFTMSLM